MPVIFGPNHERFQEAVSLIAHGGGFCIGNTDDFSTLMRKLSTDDAFLADASAKAGEYVKSQSGATDVIIDCITDKL